MVKAERGVLALKVGGKTYTGWEEATVQKSIETAAGGFSITVSDRTDWPLNPNMPCVVMLDDETVITGYIDTVEMEHGASTRTITVSGRDRAGDLIDCSVVHKSNEIVGQNLLQIAKALCAPFGISVSVTGPMGGVFPKVAILPGESVWQCLERLARQRGLLMVSDAVGGIVFMQPNRTPSGAALVQGKNILSATATYDAQDRFSVYYVKGQTAGTDDTFGATAAQIEARSQDVAVDRYRPLVVLSETNTSGAEAQTRANFEATTRAARSAKFEITVQGWQRDDNGTLWQPNQLVTCKIPSLRVDGDMLISAINYRKSAQTGTTAVLKLARPDAFMVEKVAAKKDKTGGDSSFKEIFG